MKVRLFTGRDEYADNVATRVVEADSPAVAERAVWAFLCEYANFTKSQKDGVIVVEIQLG